MKHSNSDTDFEDRDLVAYSTLLANGVSIQDIDKELAKENKKNIRA